MKQQHRQGKHLSNQLKKARIVGETADQDTEGAADANEHEWKERKAAGEEDGMNQGSVDLNECQEKVVGFIESG